MKPQEMKQVVTMKALPMNRIKMEEITGGVIKIEEFNPELKKHSILSQPVTKTNLENSARSRQMKTSGIESKQYTVQQSSLEQFESANPIPRIGNTTQI